MTNPEEQQRAEALSRALRGGVSGEFPNREGLETRPPTPSGVLGPRAAADNSKRRKQLDDAEDKILNG